MLQHDQLTRNSDNANTNSIMGKKRTDQPQSSCSPGSNRHRTPRGKTPPKKEKTPDGEPNPHSNVKNRGRLNPHET